MAAATAIRYSTREYVQRVFTLSEGADGAHRSWIMLFPLGEYRHESYGKLNFTRERLSEIKRKFDGRVRYIDIALDADHAAAKGDTRATGWIERLELREQVPDASAPNGVQPGGLWGLIKWTPYGLTMLRADEYRYFSPEFGPWKDPISGRVFKDVLCGGGLTNRPFLKNMGPVMLSELRRRRLAEVSTRAWGSVDKSKLPDSAFLDPTNRRLPIYEGAGAIGADGRYTQRGPLNIHGARAALAAIHGARSGKPMSGLPAGTVARLQALLSKHDSASLAERPRKNQGQGGPNAKMETRTELPDGTVRIKRGPSPEEIAADERDAAQRLAERGERETAKARKQAAALLAEYERLTADAGDEDDEETDDGGELNATLRELRGEDEGDDDEAFTLDDSMDDSSSDAGDETYDEDDDDGDDEHDEDLPEPPMPKKGKAGKSKKMAQRANVKGAGMGSKTCAEIAAGPKTLSEARGVILRLAEEREATRKLLHEHAVKDELSQLKIGALTLSEATAGKKSEQLAKAKLGLSKRFSDLYQEVLGAEGIGFLLDESGRGDIRELVKTALSFAVVDLAQRGSGFDMEQRKTKRSGDAKRRQAEGGYATLAEETVTLAEEKSVDLNELRRLAGAGNVKAKQELRKHLYEASARSGYGRD